MQEHISLIDTATETRTDKAQHPMYLATYANLIGDRRLTPFRLLELGVYGGGSVEMWLRYCPFATIIGIDAHDYGYIPSDATRVHLYTGWQEDADFVNRVADQEGPFDFVIDDCSHHAAPQLVSFRALWPWMRRGGWYIIEDTHTWWKFYPGEGNPFSTFIDQEKLFCTVSDMSEVRMIGSEDDANVLGGMLCLRRR